MDGARIRALTGRRRTRPTSPGCRRPWQPRPGRAPLIAAQAAVQTNRATSLTGAPGGSCYWFRFRTMLLTSFEVGAGRCWPAPTISEFVDLDPESPERLGRVLGPHGVDRALDRD